MVQGGCSEDSFRNPLVLGHGSHLVSFILRFSGVFWGKGGSGMGGKHDCCGLMIK